MEQQLGVFGSLIDHTLGNQRIENGPMNFGHMHALVSHLVQLFTHVYLYAQIAVDVGDIRN